MAITASRKQSDLEKRLHLLRQQVYGKMDRSEHQLTSAKSEKLIHKSTGALIHRHAETPTTDIIYLTQDLFKILTLSALAIGAQLILFFLTRNHILNLNFF